MIVCRARLSRRSPPRLRRCRIVWSLEAGTGATAARRAKAASERTRPRCDQATITSAATIGPDAGLVEQLWCERTDVAEDLVLELVRLGRRGRDPPCERAQDELGREFVDGAGAGAAQ